MKGQTINYRKTDGTWVTGIFIPDSSTQVSVNSRQYYNYCRNDSGSVRQALFWDGSLDQDINYAKTRNQYRQFSRTQRISPNKHFKVQQQYNNDYQTEQQETYDRNVNRKLSLKQIPIRQSMSMKQSNQKINIKQYLQKEKKSDNSSLINATGNNTNRSTQKVTFKEENKLKKIKQAQSNQLKTNKQTNLLKKNKKRQKSAERVKIQQYIKSLVPYTREMSNTRFRTLYDKECLQTYGKNNLNEPIGGIIYGNHMKTFNIGPHSGDNNPKYYQTHHTALNYAKRTKLSDEEKWRKIEIQYNKKLNLRPVNNTLKQGKDIDIQQINQDNMYQVMKQNHQFAKQHKDQIRQLEKEHQKQKQQQYKKQVEARKHQKNNFTKDTQATQKKQYTEQQIQQKLNNQVIYKYTDKDGNVRYAADRHAITCYVDLNFPENDAVYTQQLINRNPIFPQQVRQKDKNLDQIRRQNYYDSVEYNYPAHYLVPNVDYSKVHWGNRQQALQKKKSLSRQKSLQKTRKISKPPKLDPNPNQQRSQNIGDRISPKKNANLINNRNQENNDYDITKTKGNQNIYRRDQNQKNQIYGNERFRNDKNDRYERNEKNESNNPNYCKCIGANQGCVTNIKDILLQRAAKDPHLATKILSYAKKYDCEINNNKPTKLIENLEYDPNNYYPHAIHELNPKLYSDSPVTRIPYAGISYEQKEKR